MRVEPAGVDEVHIERSDGNVEVVAGRALDAQVSQAVFDRSGDVGRVLVRLAPSPAAAQQDRT